MCRRPPYSETYIEGEIDDKLKSSTTRCIRPIAAPKKKDTEFVK